MSLGELGHGPSLLLTCPPCRYNISQLEQWLRAEGLQQSGAREVLEPLVQAAQLLQVKKVTEEDARALCSLCTVLSPQQVPGVGVLHQGCTGTGLGTMPYPEVSGCAQPFPIHGPHYLLQVVKILRAYTPAVGLEERISPSFISSVEVSGTWGAVLGWGGCPALGPLTGAALDVNTVSPQKQLQDQYGGGPSQLLVDTSHLFPVCLPFTASPLHLDELCIPDTLDLAFLVRR